MDVLTDPLDMNQVFTMASQFIVSCPSDNPFHFRSPYPALALTNQSTAVPGQTSELQYKRPMTSMTPSLCMEYS